MKDRHRRALAVYAYISWACVLGGLAALGGCAAGRKQTTAMPSESSFVVSEYSLSEDRYPDADGGPEALVRQGVRAWKTGSFEQAGDLFLAAYSKGKAYGWLWKTDAKIRLLGHALRAYHSAGAVHKEVDLARYMLGELSDVEKQFLPMEQKVLLYFATMQTTEPAFASEIPRSLLIGGSKP